LDGSDQENSFDSDSPGKEIIIGYSANKIQEERDEEESHEESRNHGHGTINSHKPVPNVQLDGIDDDEARS